MDGAAGRYGHCHNCSDNQMPNELRTECVAIGDVNNKDVNSISNTGISISYMQCIFILLVLSTIIFVVIVIGVLHSKWYGYRFIWKSLVMFLIYLLDFVTDLIFCVSLYACYNNGNDDIVCLVLFILSILCLLLPSIIALHGMENVISVNVKENMNDTELIKYFAQNSLKLYIVCFIIGNFVG
eukprot:786_1